MSRLAMVWGGQKGHNVKSIHRILGCTAPPTPTPTTTPTMSGFYLIPLPTAASLLTDILYL